MEIDLTALKRKWLKKHLQELRAVKEEAKGGMLRFVGILCAAIPLLTAAVYFVGMRYYHGYVGQFGLGSTEFSLPADTTLPSRVLSTDQAMSAVRAPSCLDSSGIAYHAERSVFQGEVATDALWWLFRFFVLLPIVLKGVKIAHRYPAPFTFDCLIWLKSAYLKFAIFILPPLLVIMTAEHINSMGEELASSQILCLEQGTWPVSEAHNQSPLLGNEPHIRIACNGTYCALSPQGGGYTAAATRSRLSRPATGLNLTYGRGSKPPETPDHP